MKEELTQARLKELLHYDPETGVFTWLIAQSKYKPGDVAGTKFGYGYLAVRFDGKQFLLHRLAWLYVTGSFAPEIDHRNGNGIGKDNRFENLRDCSHRQNSWNTKLKTTNTSGHKGVHWCKNRGMWTASIRGSGKRTNLGYFNFAEDASEAYKAKAKELHGEFYREVA
jgi:hypothetical protein